MIVYIKGENDVLSNFYPCNLEFDNDVFKSAEHLYQSKKAIYHERYDLDDDIRSAPDVKTEYIQRN